MLIDTHCHINMMVKEAFDRTLTTQEIDKAQTISAQARTAAVTTIINVGTNIIESKNCIALAQKYPEMYATIGIHPNDATDTWHSECAQLLTLLQQKNSLKIVGIGECGIDKHYKDYNLRRQQDVFKAQIELALEYDVGLVIHSRDAADETLKIVSEYKKQLTRAVMHCFSYDQSIATDVINMGLLLGIGGTVTYPKNNELRSIILNTTLANIVLETDAPFLAPQEFRGTQNNPAHIRTIAEFIAKLRGESFETVAQATTVNAKRLFGLN